MPLKYMPCFLRNLPDSLVVSSLMQGRSWSKQNILEIGNQMLYEFIQKVPLSTDPYEDKWVWKYGQKGMTLTKTVYHFLMLSKLPDSPWWDWRKLWMLCVAPKTKSLLEATTTAASNNLPPGQVQHPWNIKLLLMQWLWRLCWTYFLWVWVWKEDLEYYGTSLPCGCRTKTQMEGR